MSTQPKYIEHGMGDFNPPDDSKREAAINARFYQLEAEMWQDKDYLSDAFNDAATTLGWYRSDMSTLPRAVEFLELVRDGTDDIKAMLRLRSAMKEYISDTAAGQAEEEFNGENEL
jgi:hypothetical protein